VHQHTPEIARHLGRSVQVAEGDLSVTFTPHLLPVRRGLLSTCYARPRHGATSRAVADCLAEAYKGSPFVAAVPPDKVTLNAVVGTNNARVGAVADGDVVVAIGSIDNLLKGAAGQALQNLNLVFGQDPALGLSHLQRIAP
jgi:N-acetyl-gamma-glutamyl-phosphate reductase